MYSIETVRVHYGTMAVQKPPPACPILVYQFMSLFFDHFVLSFAFECYHESTGVQELQNWIDYKRLNGQVTAQDRENRDTTLIAILTIFASGEGLSSGSNLGHAWIEIKNFNQNGSISIGAFSGIPFNYEFVLGTWGNRVEHTGLWYSLERWCDVDSPGCFGEYVSKSIPITASKLTALNSYILNSDSWSYFYNCSSFAVGAWNLVASPFDQLSAGLINTPSGLKNSIISSGSYEQKAFNSSYIVYYANGASTPIPSVYYHY